MVMGVESTQDQDSLKLPFTNVFIVGDTVSGATLEDVVRSSIQLAHALTKMRTTWTRQSIIV